MTARTNARTRVAVVALSFSAAGLAGLVAKEHYTDTAIIPTKNDRPTVGFGSTFREDGSPVQMGDRIDPPRAIARTVAHISKDETGLKNCVRAPLNQIEYDVLVDFTYQYGVKRACDSEMVRQINATHYTAACYGYTRYKFSGGYDCSTPGNRVCAGVWTRNLERQAKCLSAQ